MGASGVTDAPSVFVNPQCEGCVWLRRQARAAWCEVFAGSVEDLPPEAFVDLDGRCRAKETDLSARRAWALSVRQGLRYARVAGR